MFNPTEIDEYLWVCIREGKRDTRQNTESEAIFEK
jgi:hypothetical protein